MIPIRSQVENWDTSHLDVAHEHWNGIARQWVSSFNAVHEGAKAPSGTEFTGRFADGAVMKTKLNANVAEEISEHFQRAGNAAWMGKPDIDNAKSRATDAINAAEDAKFTVPEDVPLIGPEVSLALIDRNPPPPDDIEEVAYRQHQRYQYGGAISDAVTALVAEDTNVSESIGRSLNGIQGVDFRMGGGMKLDGTCGDARQRAQDKMEDDAMWAVIGAVVGGIVSGGNPLVIAGGAAVAGGIPILRGTIDPPDLPECR